MISQHQTVRLLFSLAVAQYVTLQKLFLSSNKQKTCMFLVLMLKFQMHEKKQIGFPVKEHCSFN